MSRNNNHKNREKITTKRRFTAMGGLKVDLNIDQDEALIGIHTQLALGRQQSKGRGRGRGDNQVGADHEIGKGDNKSTTRIQDRQSYHKQFYFMNILLFN